jgi:hypothetical protein
MTQVTPAASAEVKSAITDAASTSVVSGDAQQGAAGEKKVKSEKECKLCLPDFQPSLVTDLIIVERERKKAEKAKKFAEKKDKALSKAAAAPVSSKGKEKKAKLEAAKEEALPEYKEDTPVGEKKSMRLSWTILRIRCTDRSQSSNHYSTIHTIRPTIQPWWSLRGMHGGRKKASSSQSLVRMARSRRKATLSSPSPLRTSLALSIWDTLCPMHYRILLFDGIG